jgi:Protein of unknown function, DUF547
MARPTLPISTYNRSEQKAYWINLYNALTVSLVLQHYPVESIRDIDISGRFSDGPGQAKLLRVEGEGGVYRRELATQLDRYRGCIKKHYD